MGWDDNLEGVSHREPGVSPEADTHRSVLLLDSLAVQYLLLKRRERKKLTAFAKLQLCAGAPEGGHPGASFLLMLPRLTELRAVAGIGN